jgi:hypothetical protein
VKHFVNGRILKRVLPLRGIRSVAEEMSVDKWKVRHFSTQGRGCGGAQPGLNACRRNERLANVLLRIHCGTEDWYPLRD